jgi:hypothetical protein
LRILVSSPPDSSCDDAACDSAAGALVAGALVAGNGAQHPGIICLQLGHAPSCKLFSTTLCHARRISVAPQLGHIVSPFADKIFPS